MNYVWAFVIGGAFCVIGQLLIDFTKLTPARVLVCFVVAGVVLSALDLYDPLAEFAGAGATVPLLGFGHLLAQGVEDAVAESGLLGALTGGFCAAAGGVTASLTAGFLMSLVGKKATTKADAARLFCTWAAESRKAAAQWGSGFVGPIYFAALLAALARRATLREAVFLCRTPFAAALSMATTAAFSFFVLVGGAGGNGGVCLLDDCFQVGLDRFVVHRLFLGLHDTFLSET